MKNYLVCIISHGDLSDELYNVTQNLIPLKVPVLTYSNKKIELEEIVRDIEKEIKKITPSHVLIFIDLMGGSCWHAAMRLKKNQANISIITGVNVPVLVSFATNFHRLDWTDLIEKIETDGKKAIKVY